VRSLVFAENGILMFAISVAAIAGKLDPESREWICRETNAEYNIA
jgi:hypothetical protein